MSIPSKTKARLLAVSLLVLGAAGCVPNSLLITPVSTHQDLVKETLYSESLLPQGDIVILDVEGVMINADTPGLFTSGEHPVALLLEQLDKARKDPRVRGAVLRINSPGGTVTAAELMHTELERFRASGKPVVAMLMDVAASGGYYVACGTDEIIACNSTVTGSIGVIMQLFDVTGTMQKIGVDAHAIKSGKNKAAGSPFEELTPDQQAIFDSVVSDLYDQFIAVVDAGRPELSEEQIRVLADGRVYSAKQALEAGLVDRLGTMRDAIDAAKERAGIERARVVAFKRPFAHVPNYYAAAPAPQPTASQLNLLNVDLGGWRSGYRPPFMYLWSLP